MKYLLDVRLWVICGLFVVVGILSLNDTMLYTPDSPRYLLWAKSLASFEGFKDTSNPEPTLYVIHAPFYPLLLAPLAWFYSNIIIPSKFLTILFGAFLLVLFYLWTAKRTSKGAALVGAFFLAINPLTLLLSVHVLSDIPFTAFVVLFFMLAEKMADQPEEEKWAWMFVVVLTMGIFLREVGLTLLLGASSFFLLKKEYRRLLLVFTIPMFFYLIWYFRNEVYYAGIENPSMRNMRIFLGHSFTGDGASLTEEFMMRLRVNVAVYLNFSKGLILFPQFLVRLFPVVNPTDPMMARMTRMLLSVQYPLVAVQYALFAWGFVVNWKKMKTTLLVVLFSFFYLSMVLLYPVNDVRFLVPLLVLTLYYAVIGGYDIACRVSLQGGMHRLLFGLAVLVGLLLSVPNIVWISSFVANNREYVKRISDPSKPFTTAPGTPELYVRPVSLVGKWIAQQPDSSQTVLARWKELTFWLSGRKLLDYDPLLSLTLFEGMLRDYNVGYIVTLVSAPGIREFEFQMLQTRKFSFTSVYRAGRLEVIKVHHLYRRGWDKHDTSVPGTITSLSSTPAGEENARVLFHHGLMLLDSSRYDEAINVFNLLFAISHGSGDMALFKGIALECGGHFEDALALFDRFRYQPQAGPYIRQVWYHQMLINGIQAAQEDTSKSEKAMMYHRVSANYWDFGFRHRAIEVLQMALRADSNFSPGLVFGMYYSIQLGDTSKAKWFFSRVQQSDSGHLIIKPVRRIFSLMDSVRWAKTPPQRIGYELSLAKGYAAIGLRELTIDQTLAILEEDPNNVGALQVLAQAYNDKDRRWPTIQVLRRLVTLKPESQAARQRLSELEW